MKVFLDTNVLLASFTSHGLCAELMRLVLAKHTLQTGEFNILELRRNLAKKFHANEQQIVAAEAMLRSHTVVATPSSKSVVVVRDEDDRWVLACAEAGDAEVLVTGDNDLLAVAMASRVRIVNPRAAVELLR